MTTPTIPTNEPTRFSAGETLKWRKSLSEYPASDGWTLTYKFRGPASGFDAPATADGSDYLVTVASATTTPLGSGAYFWEAWAEKAGEKYLVASGQTVVKAALPNANAAFDGRSQVKRILDAIDAMVSGKASLDQQEYQIGTRMLKRIPLAELIQLRTEYARLYSQEQQAERVRNGAPFFKNVLTRFTTPE